MSGWSYENIGRKQLSCKVWNTAALKLQMQYVVSVQQKCVSRQLQDVDKTNVKNVTSNDDDDDDDDNVDDKHLHTCLSYIPSCKFINIISEKNRRNKLKIVEN